MNTYEVASGVEFFQAACRLCSTSFNLLGGQERINGFDIHAQSCCLGTHEPSDISESLNSESLSLDLAAGSRSELVAGHKYHHGDGEFCHGVGVLSGSVHRYDSMCGACFKIEIVESRTCTNDDFKGLCCFDYLFCDFVGANDHGVSIGCCRLELFGAFVLLEYGEFVSGFFNNISNAGHSCCGKRLLCREENFHYLCDFSKSCMHFTRASTSSCVQALYIEARNPPTERWPLMPTIPQALAYSMNSS